MGRCDAHSYLVLVVDLVYTLIHIGVMKNRMREVEHHIFDHVAENQLQEQCQRGVEF